MKVQITITGTVTDDPLHIVRAALYHAIGHGLINADDAVYSYGRHQGLRVSPDAGQAYHIFENALAAADEAKAPLRAQEALDAEGAVEGPEVEAELEAEAPEESVDEGAEDEPEAEGEEDGSEEQEQAAVLDVAFGSVAAATLADELNLTKADFRRKRKSGVKGFTVGDVRKIEEAK